MPKTTKTTKAKKATSVKKTKSKKTKSTSKKAKIESKLSEKVTVVPEVVNTPAVEVSVTPTQENVEGSTTETSTIDTLFKQLVEYNDQMYKLQKRMTSNLKKVMKAHQRHCKELRKNSSKSRRRSKDPNKPKRAPSGFAKPTEITDTLCDFLGVDHGTKMARTEVTKKVTAYIKEANLQVQTNKRQFVPDAKLGSILGPLDSVKKDKNGKTDAEKGYTYFNLQKYLSAQFPKKTVTA